MITAEQAKNNVLKYRKEQAERDYVQEELDSILDCIEQSSLTGSTFYEWIIPKPIAPKVVMALEKLKELGYTITQEEGIRKDFRYNDCLIPHIVAIPYVDVKISWCV